VFDFLLENKKATLQELVAKFNANDVYLNVGLRVLASNGCLLQNSDTQNNKISYSITKNGQNM